MESNLINSVKRALDVLQAVAQHPDSLGTRELARRLELPRSTVHRILQTLESYGAVLRDPRSRKYGLGPAVLHLGFSYVEQLDVRSKALPLMEQLRGLSSETVGLTVRFGDTRAYVELLESDLELRAKPQLGRSYPLYSGAPGRAILAFLGDEEIDGILARVELSARTVHTPDSPEAIWRLLRETRTAGVAYAFEETMLGLSTIAAPVFDHRGEPIASLSVSGPVSRFQKDEMERVRPELSKSAESVSGELGFRGPQPFTS